MHILKWWKRLMEMTVFQKTSCCVRFRIEVNSYTCVNLLKIYLQCVHCYDSHINVNIALMNTFPRLDIYICIFLSNLLNLLSDSLTFTSVRVWLASDWLVQSHVCHEEEVLSEWSGRWQRQGFSSLSIVGKQLVCFLVRNLDYSHTVTSATSPAADKSTLCVAWFICSKTVDGNTLHDFSFFSGSSVLWWKLLVYVCGLYF